MGNDLRRWGWLEGIAARGKGKRFFQWRSNICGLYAGRWRQGSRGRKIQIQFFSYPSARDLKKTASVLRSHSPNNVLESSPSEKKETVVVAGKARFGGGEEQEP